MAAFAEVAFGVRLHLDDGPGRFVFEVVDGGAVVVILGERGVRRTGVEFVGAEALVDFRDVVVRLRHGDDGAGLDEDGEFPERGVELVEDASALVCLSVEVVNPLAFGQVDAVADVVALLVGFGLLVDGRDEEARSVEELILRGFAKGIAVGVVEEEGADHRFPVDGFVGDGVGVGKKLAFEL